jgi:hypothetical protein
MLKPLRTIAPIAFALLIMMGAKSRAQAQDAKTPYPSMAPVSQYSMERDAEIALARSAAPQSISMDAEIMVLGNHGYENAVKGKNGFVCNDPGLPLQTIPTFGIQSCEDLSASMHPLPDPIFRSRSKRRIWFWPGAPKLKWPRR